MTDIVGKLPGLPEPIGELRSDEFDGHVFVPSGDEWPFEPLYTADQMRAYALQAVEALRREPMTDEQVQQLIFVGAVYAPDGKVTRTPQQYRDELRSAMTQGFRIAEAHHHITQKEQGK